MALRSGGCCDAHWCSNQTYRRKPGGEVVRTPLRLIANDEGADDTTPEGAVPVDIATDNGAITRRVSDAEMGTVRKTASERTAGVSTEAQKPKRSSSGAL